jgi:hypothetical protein
MEPRQPLMPSYGRVVVDLDRSLTFKPPISDHKDLIRDSTIISERHTFVSLDMTWSQTISNLSSSNSKASVRTSAPRTKKFQQARIGRETSRSRGGKERRHSAQHILSLVAGSRYIMIDAVKPQAYTS